MARRLILLALPLALAACLEGDDNEIDTAHETADDAGPAAVAEPAVPPATTAPVVIPTDTVR